MFALRSNTWSQSVVACCMDDAKLELVAGWLAKARHDLESASRLAAGPDPILDTAIYHCQQAAEKAIKGYLVYCDRVFDKTHDLNVLIKAALPFHPGFADWLEVGVELTPYATEYRYPGAEDPDLEEYEQAFRSAARFLDFVLSLLPFLK